MVRKKSREIEREKVEKRSRSGFGGKSPKNKPKTQQVKETKRYPHIIRLAILFLLWLVTVGWYFTWYFNPIESVKRAVPVAVSLVFFWIFAMTTFKNPNFIGHIFLILMFLVTIAFTLSDEFLARRVFDWASLYTTLLVAQSVILLLAFIVMLIYNRPEIAIQPTLPEGGAFGR